MVGVGGGGIGGGAALGTKMKEPGFGPSNTVIWFVMLWANLHTLYHQSAGLVWLDCQQCQGNISNKLPTWDPVQRCICHLRTMHDNRDTLLRICYHHSVGAMK